MHFHDVTMCFYVLYSSHVRPKKWKPQKLGQMQMHAWPHSAMSFSSGSASDASTTECSSQGPNHPLKLQHCSSNSQLPLRGIRNPFASLKTWIGVFLRGRFGCAWCLMWDDWLEKLSLELNRLWQHVVLNKSGGATISEPMALQPHMSA